jgi:hypothetical protein
MKLLMLFMVGVTGRGAASPASGGLSLLLLLMLLPPGKKLDMKLAIFFFSNPLQGVTWRRWRGTVDQGDNNDRGCRRIDWLMGVCGGGYLLLRMYTIASGMCDQVWVYVRLRIPSRRSLSLGGVQLVNTLMSEVEKTPGGVGTTRTMIQDEISLAARGAKMLEK